MRVRARSPRNARTIGTAVAAVLAAGIGTVLVSLAAAPTAPAAAPPLVTAVPARLVTPAAAPATPPTPAPAEATPTPVVTPAAATKPAALTKPATTTNRPRATTKPAAETEAAAAPEPAPEPTKVRGTPCTSTARACVDLEDSQAWLIEDGEIVRGPVDVRLGDEVDPTPAGTFHILRQVKDYFSREYQVPMPYSSFFKEGGFAFHEGRQDTPSAGCVKMSMDDAQAWFAFLKVGDEVQLR